MGKIWAWCGFLLYLAVFVIPFRSLVITALPHGYLIASPSTSWANRLSAPDTVKFTDGSTVRIILNSGSTGPVFACGFFCNLGCNDYLFAIFILYYNVGMGEIAHEAGPQVVWSANKNNPVSINATLQLTTERGLVLQDADGTTAWSTNISRKSVAGLNLTDMGNLLLLDENNATIWQSFDHPTDSLVLGQKLVVGQKLTSSASANYQIQGALFSLSIFSDGLFAFIESNASAQYYSYASSNISYVQFLNGSLAFFTVGGELNVPYNGFLIPLALSLQYMRFGPDGHFRLYEWSLKSSAWKEIGDLFSRDIGYCDYPLACGNYGICINGQCSCPQTGYVKEINYVLPESGCSLVTPFSCEHSQYGDFFELEDFTSFAFRTDLRNTDSENCRQACLKNCSCKAAIFHQIFPTTSLGDCYLASQIFSLKYAEMKTSTYYSSSTSYIRVPNDPTTNVNVPTSNFRSRLAPLPEQTNNGKKRNRLVIILGSTVASLFGLFLLIGILVLLFRKNKNSDEAEEYYLDHVPGMPTRYSFEDLQVITNNFNKKLGGGGFRTVFEGTQIDGTIVAVKRLHGSSQIQKSFLAEVETIGSIHHFNLVKLIGFCAQKSHRLLAYEYMSNGSLDKWIFHKHLEFTLDWHRRKKIILDIAKGLSYLHEDCSKKIVHLDIKPENILLDENFNAKVADFGLSKLIDRDQSQVITIMRGTPGYLAPEWLSSVITEKVDVYSFGVVLLEILSGRRHFDSSQPEEAMHLLGLFKEMVQKKQLWDMVDKYDEDMKLHGAEVVDMMRVAAWCLQNDFAKRPSMSVVVKVLEGVVDVEENLDYNFCNPPISNTRAKIMRQEVYVGGATTLFDSVLSGPR